jgi:hypothetical protein
MLAKSPKDRISDCELLLSKKQLFDQLYKDVSSFLMIANETLHLSEKAKLKRGVRRLSLGLTAKVTQWRAKRKGNVLFSNFDQILNRIDEMRNKLQISTDSCMVAVNTLSSESKQFRTHLYGCKLFNQEKKEAFIPALTQTINVLSSIERSEIDMQGMLDFFDEVKSCEDLQAEELERERSEKLLEEQHRAAMYVPWAMRVLEVESTDEPEDEPEDETFVKSEPFDRRPIEKKMEKLKRVYTVHTKHRI